jgi:ATP-dependent DNA helicase RecG
VYPLVEDSEKLDLKSVQKAYDEHVTRFGFENVGLLHGKKKPEEKNYIMEAFRSKKIPILVTTSVIEVGLDNPDATLMVIEHAERFGLAQLHQLRGRVGRGKHASYCVLVSDKKNEESWQRLQILEKTLNGFELAEEDFKIRGPGNILGTEQSGLPPLRIADLTRDMDILKDAKDSAQKLLETDPSLMDHPMLKERVQAFEEMITLGTSN